MCILQNIYTKFRILKMLMSYSIFFYFFGKKTIKINKKKRIQRLGDIRPDPGTTQKGVHQ